MTSLAKARAAGIPEDRLIHVLGRRIGGRAARLPGPRPVFREPRPERGAQGGDGSRRRHGKAFDAIELYSCFPCVPKMARRTLGAWPRRAADGHRRADVFRRAAQHLHDACGLRDGAKLARRREARAALRPGRFRHQASRAGAVAAGAESARWRRTPACRPRPTGIAARCRSSSPRPTARGSVESFTVLYGRAGDVEHGVVMLRTSRQCPRAGARARR
jgi:acetyl-CoA C-acetyltransferase